MVTARAKWRLSRVIKPPLPRRLLYFLRGVRVKDKLYIPQAKTVEWETPLDLFRQLDEEFHFNLDPCCTHENAKCDRHYTKKDNGLAQPWGGFRVFCNPPYGREMPEWIRKAYEERNNAECIVMLIPSRTDTRAFHDYIYGTAEIRFIKGRLKFGGATRSAPFPSMLAIYRRDNEPQTTDR